MIVIAPEAFEEHGEGDVEEEELNDELPFPAHQQRQRHGVVAALCACAVREKSSSPKKRVYVSVFQVGPRLIIDPRMPASSARAFTPPFCTDAVDGKNRRRKGDSGPRPRRRPTRRWPKRTGIRTNRTRRGT